MKLKKLSFIMLLTMVSLPLLNVATVKGYYDTDFLEAQKKEREKDMEYRRKNSNDYNEYVKGSWYDNKDFLADEGKKYDEKWINKNTIKEPTPQEVVDLLYSKWNTIFNTPEKFMYNSNITREQAAKFFAVFKKTIFPNSTLPWNTSCNFKDLKKADPSLQASIVEACQMGLFNGYKGKFSPHDNLTYGQAITVLMRIVNGWKMDESGVFYKNYFKKAIELGITNSTEEGMAELKVTRWTVWKWFHKTNQLKEAGKI